MVNKYIPEKGDVVFLEFDPHSGKEQAGERPAVVISPRQYNQKTGLAIFCPITTKIKNYPFEVRLAATMQTKGVVLSDHVKSLDWRARNARFKEKNSHKNLQEILTKLQLLLIG